MSRTPKAVRPPLATSPFRRTVAPPPTTDEFSVGDRVTHDRCGMGRVIKVDPASVTVEFSDGGIVRVPAGARGFERL